ncbi:MAG: aminoacyl-tRNA hydrolase [Clostridia bacterium]|nr:aminoacyl-tRNA hydrolase [Clostridia bacterium]MDD4375157.1 aminoacyl-tRNA hydrolase [Clostridia bacterium]
MKIIIGLGNVGKEYKNTRHNVGFMFLDYYAERNGNEKFKKRDNYYYLESNFKGGKIVLIKPSTYMNLSGEAVIKVLKWYKANLEDLIIIYDDVDLPFGNIRYREEGSAGTHNGMKNIVTVLKTEKIKRIKVGIENRENLDIGLADYVLSNFSKKEISVLYENTFLELEEKLKQL